jgi:hypothetical protein
MDESGGINALPDVIRNRTRDLQIAIDALRRGGKDSRGLFVQFDTTPAGVRRALCFLAPIFSEEYMCVLGNANPSAPDPRIPTLDNIALLCAVMREHIRAGNM